LAEQKEEEEIPLDVLTNHDALVKFMEIYLVKITTLKSNIEKQQEQTKEARAHLNFFEEKYELLEDYKIFMESDGFSIIKQTVDEHAKEIRQAKKDRIADKKVDDYEFFCETEACYLKKGHDGPCSDEDND